METKIRILLADANPDFAALLADTLAAERDMEERIARRIYKLDHDDFIVIYDPLPKEGA